MKKNTENNKTFTMEKTMVMYQKLLNFDLLWGKNMALIKPKTVELWKIILMHNKLCFNTFVLSWFSLAFSEFFVADHD